MPRARSRSAKGLMTERWVAVHADKPARRRGPRSRLPASPPKGGC